MPLVLLHGFGNDAHIYDDFAPQVAQYYRTIAIDLRGHGDSGHDDEHRYDYAYHVRDLECVLAALGVERFVLVGHSLGGRIATLFAGAHPERMAGLVLVDSGPELDARGIDPDPAGLERRSWRGRHARRSARSPSTSGCSRSRTPRAQPAALKRMARHGLRRSRTAASSARPTPRSTPARAA